MTWQGRVKKKKRGWVEYNDFSEEKSEKPVPNYSHGGKFYTLGRWDLVSKKLISIFHCFFFWKKFIVHNSLIPLSISSGKRGHLFRCVSETLRITKQFWILKNSKMLRQWTLLSSTEKNTHKLKQEDLTLSNSSAHPES